MKLHRNSAIALFVLLLACLLPSFVHAQAWKEAVGYNALLAEKGAALENGTGVRVMQPEASSAGSYMPNAALFPGVTFSDGSSDPPSAGSTGHATGVGFSFYGSTSMASGITDVTGYNGGHYLFGVLGATTPTLVIDPPAQGFDVGNHSYILGGASDEDIIDRVQRFDYVINRDNTVMVVATNNGSGSATPAMLAPSMNAITVGRTDGNHARGPTLAYGPGRLKPDIVAPASSTSGATPLVSSAAALLREASEGTNAIHNEVIKANLFAGATKEEFASWDRTTTRPIDEVFGFGELNIYNSYHILEGGEFAVATSDPSTNIGYMGWDYGDFNGTDDLYYDFEILAGNPATELSAALVWNNNVIDNDPSILFDPEDSIANLDLELFDSSGSFLGSLVDSSLSTTYNYEHLYLTHLDPGNYTFRVSGDIATDYGFSWRITAVPEPSSLMLLSCLALGGLVHRRRKLKAIAESSA